MNYHYSDRRGAASRFDDREGWEDSRSFRNDGYQFPEEDSDPRYDEDDYSASSPFDDDEMDGDYYPRRRHPTLRNRSRKGERKNRGERSHHSSFLLFLRNLTLALSFVLITLIAIYWERLPDVTEKVKTAFLSGRDRITDLVVNHRTAGVTEGPETEKDISDSDPLDEEIPDELAMIPTTITPSDATGEQVTTEEIVFSEKTPSVGESSGSLSAQKDLPSLSKNGRTTHGPLETPMKAEIAPKTGSRYISATEPTPPESGQILASLGAKNGKLQRWGEGGKLWRYSCEAVPLTSNQGYAKYFEAVGQSPDEVLEAVIGKIQKWQGELAFRDEGK